MFSACLPAAAIAAEAISPSAANVGDSSAVVRLSDHSPPGLMVGIGSHALHINCTGSGAPAVILDAGLGGTSYDWAKVQPAVAAFTTVCSYDRAGYGWSESGPPPRTSARVASELARLLVYASVPPPYVLVGHSLGGLNMRLFAHRHPGRVAGMALVDATHEGQFERLEPAGGKRLIAPNRRAFIISNHWEVPAGIPAGIRPLVQSLVLTPRAVRSLYLELASMRVSAQQVRDAHVRFPNVPVQVIIRGEDRGAGVRRRAREQVWRDLQRELVGTSPTARLVVAPASGHHVHLETPDVVVRSVRELVEQARRR